MHHAGFYRLSKSAQTITVPVRSQAGQPRDLERQDAATGGAQDKGRDLREASQIWRTH